MPSPFDDIFGTQGPQWTQEQIVARIRGEAARQKVDPDLAVALATQESSLRPDNPGDAGKSRGVFHLQEKAAIDAGIDPRWRDDPGVGIYAGVRYLKQKLQQSGGNVEQALSRYNRGTPDYRGIGDPDYVYHVMRHYPGGHPLGQAPTDQEAYRARLNKTFGAGTAPADKRQPPGIMARIGNVLSPASAEAATPAQGQPAASPVWDDIFGATPAPPAAPATQPQPPTATSTPEQDAAYRASRGTQPPPPVSQTPTPAQTQPQPQEEPQTPDTSWTPGMRFQALPSITQLDPADRLQKTTLFASLSPALQEEFLRSEEPQAGGLAVGGGAVRQAPPVTDPAALLAGGRPAPAPPAPAPARAKTVPVSQAGMSDEERTTQVRQELAAWEQQAGRPWREGDPRMPSEKRLGVPDEKPLEEGITKPSTMIPLLMPGAGAKAGMRILPEAWRWVGRIGGEALTQTAGELTGKAIETGQAPNWQEIATTTAWNLAPQAGEELFRAVPRAILRSGQGARTLLSDVAAQESKGLGRRVFHPQDEQVLSKMFEDVKASGVKLDIDPVTDLFTSLQPSQRQVLLRDIKAISSPLAAALQRTGTPGAPRITGWDIGDLQTMRSELIKRGHAVRTPERQDLINEMRMAVDDAISHGMAVGSTAAGGNPATLKAAQAGWRRLKQSDDLQALVTKHTNYSPNLAYQDLNLAALRKSLDGTNPLGRKVAASLGDTETAALQAELATLAKRYPFVKVPNSIMNIGGKVGLPGAAYLAITGNLPGAAVAASSAVMALALQSPRAMSVFRSAIVNGKGRLSTNDIAAIVNAARQVSDVEESSGTPQ